MPELQWIDLRTTDPAFNLAAEQFVFEMLPKDKAYFMLWQNDNAIIIGKYQNTQAEINEKYVREHKIKVVRRLSGGGAVYHDMGNLNFTFIADAGELEQLNMRIFCEPIVSALSSIGVKAEINGRNDMTIDGKKFSGNAQYMRGGRIMHHGTIMFSSNLGTLTNALNVDPSKIESKGMKSVRSRVTNIAEHTGGSITLEDFRRELKKEIAESNGGTEYRFSETDLAEIEKIRAQRYEKWEWNYGKSPEGIIKKSCRFPDCGKVDIYIRTDKGLISSVQFRGDFFSKTDPTELEELLLGCKYDRDELGQIISQVRVEDYFLNLSPEQLLDLLVT